MKSKLRIICAVFLFSVLSIVVVNLGCQSNAPNSPNSDVKITRTTDQLHFLKPQKIRFNKDFRSEQYVKAADGGTILVGDEISGYSSINFTPGDLDADALIVFGWNSQGYFTELSPHGLMFNHPVRLNLSYKDADLSGVVEDNIHIWYYDDNDNTWELIGGEVNKMEKRVDGYINHFSLYAIAGED